MRGDCSNPRLWLRLNNLLASLDYQYHNPSETLPNANFEIIFSLHTFVPVRLKLAQHWARLVCPWHSQKPEQKLLLLRQTAIKSYQFVADATNHIREQQAVCHVQKMYCHLWKICIKVTHVCAHTVNDECIDEKRACLRAVNKSTEMGVGSDKRKYPALYSICERWEQPNYWTFNGRRQSCRHYCSHMDRWSIGRNNANGKSLICGFGIFQRILHCLFAIWQNKIFFSNLVPFFSKLIP